MRPLSLRVTLLGKGQMGQALARTLRHTPHQVSLRAWRSGMPSAPFDADLLLLCVRDRILPEAAGILARSGRVRDFTVVAHLAGAAGPELLSGLRDHCAGIGRIHPFLSVTQASEPRCFEGAFCLVDGTPVARRRLRQVFGPLGVGFISGRGIRSADYHFAAALMANGAVALAAGARCLLRQAGISSRRTTPMLASLLGSVARNLAQQGLPEALTGPVRRGDVETVRRQLSIARAAGATINQLFLASLRGQIELASELGEATPLELMQLTRLARRGRSS